MTETPAIRVHARCVDGRNHLWRCVYPGQHETGTSLPFHPPSWDECSVDGCGYARNGTNWHCDDRCGDDYPLGCYSCRQATQREEDRRERWQEQIEADIGWVIRWEASKRERIEQETRWRQEKERRRQKDLLRQGRATLMEIRRRLREADRSPLPESKQERTSRAS